MKGYAADQLDQALTGADVVVIPAGVPRKVSILFHFSYLIFFDCFHFSLV